MKVKKNRGRKREANDEWNCQTSASYGVAFISLRTDRVGGTRVEWVEQLEQVERVERVGQVYKTYDCDV